MVADGTLHSDQGRDFIFQTEVGMNLEASQVAARHFELAMFRQQQGITAKITDRGETTLFKQTSRGTRKQQQQHESPPARRLRSAGNSEERRRLSRASSSILADEG